MKDSVILRTARVGGFNKEDVLTYVDELNSKIDMLKSELEKSANLTLMNLKAIKKKLND